MTKFDPLICHERFLNAETAIHDLLLCARQGDPQILPIVGPSRVGKSTLLRSLPSAPRGTSHREVLIVTSPKHLSRRALPDACLAALGLMPDLYRNQVMADQALLKGLKQAGTRLVVFDETQHMLERAGSTTARAAGDFLKTLFDEARCSVLLLGLPSMLALFQANEQLAGRSRREIEYYPYQWDGDEFLAFRAALAGALAALEEWGWQTFSSNDVEFARRMYLASAGRYGVVHRLFQEVVATAQGSAKHADYPAFAQAFDQAIMQPGECNNPFEQSLVVETEHLARAYVSVMPEVFAPHGGC
ncbi:transposition helper protein [Pseudomonas sp. ATCC 13867]|uniref:TniB family NTP-binding protein n=1 Tax=Pseudomonas sp. ATCC 13867 TaxID=1294143 RepID=UPI0002C4DEA1|nr:TniB family NTP-binding protein [Pseudomonas sp. ATCC 13867]AGI21901.1 transposition helper protein [Pseudomonas sp. ATCC 13867]RFQ16099.1 transposition helper protein [Pseudomonas sp. ATCC 13867]